MRFQVFALILVLPAVVHSQDVTPILDGAQVEFSNTLTKSMEEELQMLGAIADIEQNTIVELRHELTRAIRAGAAKAPRTGGGLELHARLIPAVEKYQRLGLAMLIERLKDSDKIAAITKDVETRIHYRRKTIQMAFVSSVDQVALLTSEQMPKVEAIGKELYLSGKLPEVFRLLRSGPPKGAADKPLKAVLTASQFARWQGQSHGFGRLLDDQARLTETQQQRRESLTAPLQSTLTCRTNWLANELKLSPKQIKRVRLVTKRTVERIIERQLKTEGDARSRILNGKPLQKDWDTLRQQPYEMISASRWDEFVSRVLTEPQKKQLKEARDRRAHRAGRVMAAFLIGSFAPSGNQLNGRQQTNTYSLFTNAIGPLPRIAGPSPEHFEGITRIPRETLLQAMGKANLERFQPLLSQLKQAIAVRKRQEEDNAEQAPDDRI